MLFLVIYLTSCIDFIYIIVVIHNPGPIKGRLCSKRATHPAPLPTKTSAERGKHSEFFAKNRVLGKYGEIR